MKFKSNRRFSDVKRSDRMIGRGGWTCANVLSMTRGASECPFHGKGLINSTGTHSRAFTGSQRRIWTALWAAVLLALSLPLTAQTVLSIPVETTNTDMILVPLKINGQNYLMLLDTGAQQSIIGEAGVAKAKAQDTNRGLVFEAKGIRVTIQFAGGPVFQEHILSANLAGFKQRLGNASRVDGILGQDVLREFSSITINYRQKRLELRTKGEVSEFRSEQCQ